MLAAWARGTDRNLFPLCRNTAFRLTFEENFLPAVLSSLGVVFLMCIFVNCICLVCTVVVLRVFVILCVYCCFTLDAGLLARSQYPEGPATGHLDTGFSRFPCVYKRMLRWFPSFPVATTCFSCSPPHLNFPVNYLIFYV
jgi:hypothetical protein